MAQQVKVFTAKPDPLSSAQGLTCWKERPAGDLHMPTINEHVLSCTRAHCNKIQSSIHLCTYLMYLSILPGCAWYLKRPKEGVRFPQN